MPEKKPQCLTCSHNMKLSSCAPCTDKGAQIIENLALDFETDLSSTEEEKINTLKYSCKILMNNHEDFNSVDPFNSALRLSIAVTRLSITFSSSLRASKRSSPTSTILFSCL